MNHGKDKAIRKTHDAQTKERDPLTLLVIVLWIGLLLAHANKALHFYPLVIPDEYWYIADIRHKPYSGTQYPGYIYYLLYSATDWFGTRFLDAGRVLNALFFMLSAPFLHALARRVCGMKTALLLTLLVLVSPISSYTAYFMPESLYFTAFWALAWLVLIRTASSPLASGAAAGAGIAILSMIKMHGLFLLPGYVLFFLATTPRESRAAYCRTAGKVLCAVLLCFCVVRFGLGYAFAGANGLNPLGSYSDFAGEGAAAASPLVLCGYVLYSILGHVLGIIALFAVPLVFILKFFFGGSAGEKPDARSPLYTLIVFAGCLLLPLLFASGAFAGMFWATRPFLDIPEIEKVNFRYYNFLFPVFLMITAGILHCADTEKWKNTLAGRIPAILFSVACLYVLVSYFYGFHLNAMPANPELGSLVTNRFAFRGSLFLLTAVAALAVFKPAVAGRAYLYGALPLVFVTGTVITHILSIYGWGVFPDIYDKGGLFARDELGEGCADLTVVDSFINNMTKALIHIDNAETDMLPQFGKEVDVSQVKPGKKWLLVFGGLIVPDKYVESKIVYDDPALTPEVMEVMRVHNDFRSMPRYTLIKLRR